MGQGDVDGDKYYVLSERSLFPPPTAENVAADYGSQTERPVHRRSRGGAGPCAPAADHPDADLAAAFANEKLQFYALAVLRYHLVAGL